MRFYKTIDNQYLLTVGIGAGGEEISEAEYNQLLGIIANRPTAQEGYDYKLRTDTIKWELVELPPIEPEPEEASPEDYEQALQQMGVNFNDEN